MEVIVSFLILSLVLTFLLQGINNNSKSYRLAEERLHMLATAKNILSEFNTVRTVSVGTYYSNKQAASQWKVEVSPYSKGTNNLKMYWFHITVFSKNQIGSKPGNMVELKTLKFIR